MSSPPGYSEKPVGPSADPSPAEEVYWLVKEKKAPPKELMAKVNEDPVEREKWRARHCRGCRICFCNADRTVCSKRVMEGQMCYEWEMDPYRKGTELTVDINNLTVTCNQEPPKGACASILGSTNFSEGSHFWVVRVDALGTKKAPNHRDYEVERAKGRGTLHDMFPGNVTVGVSWDVSYDTAKTVGFNDLSVGWDGTYLMRNGVSKDGASGKEAALTQFQAGDTIGLLLDMQLKTVNFYRNGAHVMNVPIPAGAAYVVPVVGMKGNGDKVTVVPSAALPNGGPPMYTAEAVKS